MNGVNPKTIIIIIITIIIITIFIITNVKGDGQRPRHGGLAAVQGLQPGVGRHGQPPGAGQPQAEQGHRRGQGRGSLQQGQN